MKQTYVYIDKDGNRLEFAEFPQLMHHIGIPETANADDIAAKGLCAGWLHSAKGSELVVKQDPLSCPIIHGLNVPIQGVEVASTPEGGTFYGAGRPKPTPGKDAEALEKAAENETIGILAKNVGDEHMDSQKYAEQAERVQDLANETDLLVLDEAADTLRTLSDQEASHAKLQMGQLVDIAEQEIKDQNVPRCAITEDLYEHGHISDGEYVLAQLVNAGLITKKIAQDNLKAIKSVASINDITCGGG